jgi:signal transduction histidine kinase
LLSQVTHSELTREMLALKQGEHLCLIYEDDASEQLPSITAYLSQGLANGERCFFVGEEALLARVSDRLKQEGVGLDQVRTSGALHLWQKWDWRQPGELESDRKPRHVQDLIDEALAAGFAGARFAVDMTWTLDPEVPVERLRHWEATINSIFTPATPARIVCQYSSRRLSSAAIQASLLTHPVAVLGTEVCPNPYYDAPSLLIKSPSPSGGVAGNGTGRGGLAERTDWMISRLRWARAFDKEREQRKTAETALDEAQASRQRIEELYRLAEDRAEELRRAVEVRDEFVGLVSHELRTPITVILGNAYVLLKNGGVKSEYQEALLDIRSEAERLNRIVTNLLVLAKLEGGHQPEMEPLLLMPILERAMEEYRRRHPHRRLDVHSSSVGEPCLGNSVYVEQILLNLVNNAEKYSPPEAAFEIHIDSERGWRRVRVLDRGIGMEEFDTERVFDAFYRTDPASEKSAGIGIGLTVCKRLVEAQGGDIWARLREGGGMEFGFTLKLCQPGS